MFEPRETAQELPAFRMAQDSIAFAACHLPPRILFVPPKTIHWGIKKTDQQRLGGMTDLPHPGVTSELRNRRTALVDNRQCLCHW